MTQLAETCLLTGRSVQPFNNEYHWFNTSANLIIPDTTISEQNSYIGGAYQQATSVVTQTSMSHDPTRRYISLTITVTFQIKKHMKGLATSTQSMASSISQDSMAL